VAVRSVLQIDVNDSSFRDFTKLHEKYMAALKKAPAAWAQVEKNIDGSRESFDKLVGQMASAALLDQQREKAQEHLERLTRSSAERWQSMARSTKDFARNIGEATTSLLRWASVTGVISGLIGAGGLFGVDRLALTAAGQRRGALGLGANIGEREAFGANFSRLVDPEGFVGGVARARMDINQRTGLIAAGLTQQELSGSTGETAVALLRNLSKLAEKWDPRLFAQYIEAYRLGGVVTPEDLQRLRSTPAAEREALFRGYGADAARFRLPDDLARRWQDFTTQLAKAGQGIEQTFIRGLVPLAPGLSKLSESVEKVVQSFLSSEGLKRWIDEAGVALEQFAGYVGKPEFMDAVRTFAEGVGKLASAVATAVSWVGGTDAEHAASRQATSDRVAQLRRDRAEGRSTIGSQFADIFRAPMSPGELLGMVRKLEGSGDAAVSPAGAIGRYQIMPGTAQQYGFDPTRLKDPAYNEQAARAILADLAKKYHGNVQEVLAAYNAGPGAANRFRNAGDNPSVLPQETQRYVTRARGLDGYAPTTVTIENKTGDNVNISVNGLKQ
jgi:hypothetical protein